jgi:surface antigen
MSRNGFCLAFFAALMALSGCTTLGLGKASTTVAAATPPPANARQVASTIIAEMNGGLVGGAIGQGLSGRDKRLALEAEYKTLEYTPSGQTVDWKSDDGAHGEVVAAQPYRVGSQDCRQYSHTVYVNSQPRNAKGTACRNPDGSWTPLT